MKLLRLLLISYCCVTNNPKTQWLKIIRNTDSGHLAWIHTFKLGHSLVQNWQGHILWILLVLAGCMANLDSRGGGNGLHFWWGQPHSLASDVDTGKGAMLWQVFAIHLSKAHKELNKAQGSKETNSPVFGWVFFYHPCLRFLFTSYKYRFSFPTSLGQTPENTNGKVWVWFLFCSRLHVSLYQLALPEESH